MVKLINKTYVPVEKKRQKKKRSALIFIWCYFSATNLAVLTPYLYGDEDIEVGLYNKCQS